MKPTKSLHQIVEVLELQQTQKTDIILPAKSLYMLEGSQNSIMIDNAVSVGNMNKMLSDAGIGVPLHTLQLKPTSVIHDNFSDKLQIPRAYYERMLLGNPQLLASNVNSWLQRQEKTNYMLRTFMVNSEDSNGIARALLSDRFNTIDNWDVLMAALDAIKQCGIKVEIESCDITERKMYVRIIAPEIEIASQELIKNYKTPNGDTGNPYITTGLILSNSEVGAGTFQISPRLLVRVCNNGMTIKSDAYRRVHLGQKLETNSIIKWSDGTQRKNMELVISQVKDAVKTFLSKEYLTGTINRLENVGAVTLQNPIQAVTNAGQLYKFGDEKTASILDYFIKGGENTPFGISQAITWYGQHDAVDADERFDMEVLGAQVIFDAQNLDRAKVLMN